MRLGLEQAVNLDAQILKTVRAHSGLSRVGLARKLRIAPSTVGHYVSRLMAGGYLRENDETFSIIGAGRPPTRLSLDPNAGRFIGVDFEARSLMAMAIDFNDTPSGSMRGEIKASDSAETVLRKIEEAIASLSAENGGQLLAVGIGVPGLVDPVIGKALHYKYIRGWRNVTLVETLERKFHVPVFIENNVRSMALAEMLFGHGKGVEDFICLGIRSGIAAGIVAGGKLQRGAGWQAGEIGRWSCALRDDGTTRLFAGEATSASGGLELQEIASVRAILGALEAARRGKALTALPKGRPLVFGDVIQAAQQRDPLTLKVIGAAAEKLGWAIGQLSLALNPSCIILAGPLTLLGELLLRPVGEAVNQTLEGTGAQIPELLNSTMGEFSGALGAAALAVHEWKPKRESRMQKPAIISKEKIDGAAEAK